ncbi:hypothetical protein SPI_09214 [Niveomyces insectorum RCEF 264]|uniref:DUF1264 domain-containing protein n=1 Tax=Niveomyces insectorum RCEF 264 TaxID=1081102 RepID=A0A167M0N3_9HYPO|nr:hypothetical protein SPI_09214 [Niveomyces insectorum RCEF 264]
MASDDHEVPGEPRSMKSHLLETGAALTQDFTPVKRICAHLNAFHVYANDRARFVEANHYCAHLTEEVRQCLLYDSPNPGARLIGVEYMITPLLFATIEDAAERQLWHSHVFEVKSGMLVMPQPSPLVPHAAWERAETAEMEDVITLYGKVYHLWQVDRGDALPFGTPQLMTSFTDAGQMPDFEQIVGERDERTGTDWRRKRSARAGIAEPVIHPDADHAWSRG